MSESIESLKKVSEDKSTKAVIYAALQRSIAMLEEKSKQNFDPQKAIQIKAEQQTVAQANKIAETSSLHLSEEFASSVNESLSRAINDAMDHLKDSALDLTAVQESVKIQKAKLKELFDIEAELFSLAAIAQAKSQVEEDYNEKLEAKKIEVAEKVQELLDNAKKIEVETKDRMAQLEKEAKAAHAKQEDDWKYDFQRNKKLSTDQLTDDLNRIRKEALKELEIAKDDLAETEKALDERESQLDARTSELNGYKKEVESFPARLETAMAAARLEAEASAKKSYGFEVAILKSDFKGKETLLQSQVDSLVSQFAESKEKIEKLQSELASAYGKLESMANNAVTSASGATYIKSLEKMIENQPKGQNK